MSRRASSFRSKRLRDKRQKALFYKYAGGILLFLLALFGLSLLSRADFAGVKKVVIEGNEIVRKEAIEAIVNDALETSYLWFFSKNNFALYPRETVEKEIYRQFAAVGAVSVSFDGLKTISVSVKEYKPAYLWCESVARERCYFMDVRGYVFMESAEFSEEVMFTYYGLIDPVAPVGKTYMPEEKFTALNNFIGNVKSLKLSPVGLNARGGEDFELHIASGGSIIFSGREDLLTTFENLETIVLAQTRAEKDFLSRLDYIDVRFNSKAFVKLKNGLRRP